MIANADGFSFVSQTPAQTPAQDCSNKMVAAAEASGCTMVRANTVYVNSM